MAQKLNQGEWVIDVGANCGDTLVGMFANNPGLNFICIEPDPEFFKILERNATRLRACFKGANIKLEQSLVGRVVDCVKLSGARGTRRAEMDKSDDAIKSKKLETILDEHSIVTPRLVKSDVDGFDYDVLDSAGSKLNPETTLVFFECQFESDSQREGYITTLKMLNRRGYNYWAIFDNFGNCIVRTDEMDIILQMVDYLWRQNRGLSTRTIYYYDILLFGDSDLEFVELVIKDYNNAISY